MLGELSQDEVISVTPKSDQMKTKKTENMDFIKKNHE